MEEDIKKCIEVLNKGGLILYPTDTIWGIGCDATNPDAVKKVYDVVDVILSDVKFVVELYVYFHLSVPFIFQIPIRSKSGVYSSFAEERSCIKPLKPSSCAS